MESGVLDVCAKAAAAKNTNAVKTDSDAFFICALLISDYGTVAFQNHGTTEIAPALRVHQTLEEGAEVVDAELISLATGAHKRGRLLATSKWLNMK
ncbi:MAG: hypothetical protein NVS1B11_01170 [Terriglobales bacterium]